MAFIKPLYHLEVFEYLKALWQCFYRIKNAMSNHRKLLVLGIITVITICYLLLVAFGRNHMCVKSQAALSATQTPALSGNMWRQCMAQRLMSPRSSVGTSILGPHHHGIPAAIPSPGHLGGRLREPLVSRRTSATLPQSGRNASKWKRSRRRSPWYVIHFPSDFPKAVLGHLQELERLRERIDCPHPHSIELSDWRRSKLSDPRDLDYLLKVAPRRRTRFKKKKRVPRSLKWF